MKLIKEKILVTLILITSLFSLGFGGEAISHGAKPSSVKSGKISMHQMRNLPSYHVSEELDKLVHEDIQFLRLNRKLLDTADVEKYLRQFKVIVLRLEKEELVPVNVERLKKWVENGGTIWLDDGWSAASYFGVEQDMGPSSLIFSRENENIKRDSLTTGVSDLALLNGYYMLPDESFTEVIRQEDRVYLAYKDYGKGKLIYYPSGLTSYLDYRRLIINLREFSGGYEVPPLVGKEKETHSWED